MSVDRLAARSGGVIGTIGPIRGSGVFSLQERYALTADNYEDVSLYLKMNGANGSTTFYDSSLYGHTVTANGNAQISTAVSKFAGASAAFDGTGDSVSFEDVEIGTDDFTIEMWFKTNGGNRYAQLIGNETSGSTSGFSLLIDNNSATGGQIALYSTINGPGTIVLSSSSGDWSDDNWHHLALVRSGTTVTLYIDGTSYGSGTDATSYNGANYYVGNNNIFAGRGLNGYIDDLRITKGVARYTGNFTPPQREFRP